jgi:hypothetical protein
MLRTTTEHFAYRVDGCPKIVVKQELLKSTKAILSVPVLLGLKMRTVRLVCT